MTPPHRCTGLRGAIVLIVLAAVWQVTVTLASPGAVTPSVVASRLSGVAPLAVFFDATGTKAATTGRPFHELDYQWNFGDPASGSWNRTPRMPNLGRNSATGPLAAHVFESPGTYVVRVTARDGASAASASVQVTVDDAEAVFAGSKTWCFATAASFAGCPAGANEVVTSDFDHAVNSKIGSGRRLLFRRGDTFISNADADVDVNGPGIIGAFGSGPKPRIGITGNNNGIRLSSRNTPGISDWRIMDLELDGNSGPATNAVHAGGGIDRVTLLRLDMHHVHVGVRLSPFFLDAFGGAHALWDQHAIVDCTISNVIGGSGGNGVYIGAQRFAFLGNSIHDTTGAEHVSRWSYLYKAVLSHNNLSKPADAKIVVKLQAWPFKVNPSDASEWIVFSDNQVTTRTAWAVALGPQDTRLPEKVRHVVVERNWFAPAAAQRIALFSMGEHHTIRNNVFDLSGTSQRNGVTVGPFPGASHGTRAHVHVYNNTFYSSTGGNFTPIVFREGAGHVAKNNLGYAPASTGGRMVSGGATLANNSRDADILRTPGFVSAAPVVPADFALAAGSHAVNAGTAVPVFSDLFRLSRPGNGAFDIGAAERP